MNCPYCGKPHDEEVTTCKACGRDMTAKAEAPEEGSQDPALDLTWAKESLAAVKERSEKLQAISEINDEMAREQSVLERLQMELDRRLDVESRYPEVIAGLTATADAAREQVDQLNGQLADLLSSLDAQQGKLDELMAIQSRLLKPFEGQYEAMRERMGHRDEQLKEASDKRDAAQDRKAEIERLMEADHQRLVELEQQLEKVTGKSMSASEKMKAGNAIAGEMAAIQMALAPLRDELEEAEALLASASAQVSELEVQLQPVADEFEDVKRDLRTQREDFQQGQQPLRSEIDRINGAIESKNQEISDQEAIIARAQEEFDVAADIHEHPERIEELRQGIAQQQEKISAVQLRLRSLEQEEESLRSADLRGKAIIAAVALVAALAIIMVFMG